MKKVFVFLAFTLAFCFSALCAQNLTIAEIQDKYNKRKTAYSDVSYSDERITNTPGKSPLPSRVQTIETSIKNNKFRIEMPYPGTQDETETLKNIYIFDGTNFWSITGKTVNNVPMEFNQYSDLLMDTIDGFSLEGEELIDDRKAYKLKKQSPTIINYLWVDSELFLPLQTEKQMIKMGNTIMRTKYSDLRMEAGFPWMWKIESFINNRLITTANIKDVKFNNGLSDSLFTLTTDQQSQYDKMTAQRFEMQERIKRPKENSPELSDQKESIPAKKSFISDEMRQLLNSKKSIK